MSNWSRRQFLGHGAVSVLAATQLGAFARVAEAAPAADYQALVCILLAGGADSFNMLLPYDQARYDGYAAMRSDLALDRRHGVAAELSGPGQQADGCASGTV